MWNFSLWKDYQLNEERMTPPKVFLFIKCTMYNENTYYLSLFVQLDVLTNHINVSSYRLDIFFDVYHFFSDSL